MIGVRIPVESPRLTEETTLAYARLINAAYGLRLSAHQLSQLDGIVARMVAAAGEADAAALLRTLNSTIGADLLEQLAARFTIGETHFFRIEPQIDALRHSVLPDLIARHASRRRLRLWSAGCSTGEEPYTLAMLLREQPGGLEGWDLEIIATDLNQAALAAAQEATYGDWSFRGTSDETRQRYFLPEGRRWRLQPSIRDMVTFRQLNLALDAFPEWATGPSFDLLLCRNVTIYFGPETTARLYRHLTNAMAPGAWLVLGPSDPAPDTRDGLAPVSLRETIMWRQTCDVLSNAPSRTVVSPAARERRPDQPRSVTEVAVPTIRHTEPTTLQPLWVAPVEPWRTGHTEASLAHSLPWLDHQARPKREITPPAGVPSLDPRGYLLLGLDHLEAGRIDLAVDCLRRATFLRSEHDVSQFALGRAYLLHGDVARAAAALLHARRLLAGQPDDVIVPESDGLRAGELRQAVDALLVAVELARKGARSVWPHQ